ncbi:MAG: pyruvate dehydrogenase [Dehalococcoidia bacterium]|nr:pyruvate dehydrogenase [Dehalococcoidia bacterium]
MVHEANNVRHSVDKSKVGGHQASSASMVGILTALYFSWLRNGDRVAVKPHASPVFHAIQYLLGNLDRSYLSQLRAFGGLQSYPSRTKDPDPVDFSTGSEGMGPAATLFAAITDRYVESRFRSEASPRRRFVAVLGDAELDEGNIWEAVADETVRNTNLGNVLWIIDLNRQSLDRVIPGIKVRETEARFGAEGWRVLEAKCGRRLQAAYAGPGGVALQHRIDDMSNEEYQALLRLAGGEARERLISGAPTGVRDALTRSIAATPDDGLVGLLSDLAGHDIAELLSCFDAAGEDSNRPAVVFAYTVKGWGLPIAGNPLNHSMLLSQDQIDLLRPKLGIDPHDEWAPFPTGSPEDRICREAAARLYGPGPTGNARDPLPVTDADIPETIPGRVAGEISTQEAFGNAMVSLSRIEGPLAQRIVTTSPDVSTSTNLGGWINRTGVWAEHPTEATDPETLRLLRWAPGPKGQHVELGISEMNLFMLLGQLGLSRELNGELLFPVGTVYDCFVCRGLDALIYSVYSGSKFVFAGTPAGVSLSPEGGAHQSSVTVSLGMELPNLQLYEPAFQRETEWTLLEGLRRCADRETGLSTYLRLSTKPIDQALMAPALSRLGEAEVRRQTLLGGYRLLDARLDAGLPEPAPSVLLATAGPVIPETLEAARRLHGEGVGATVLNLTSAGRLYSAWRASQSDAIRSGVAAGDPGHLSVLIPPEDRGAPIVPVLDGASHALAFLGSVFGQRVTPLGVDAFGQSGTRPDLYHYMGIDPDHIVNAALLALTLARTGSRGR